MQIALWIHLLGVVVWVGGMFFAHMALRPAVQALAPPVRLPLLAGVLGRFLRWVALAIVLILASGGFLMAGLGGGAAVRPEVHAMTALGLVMVAVYVYLVAVPFRRLVRAAGAADWPAAGAAMATVRRLVGVNLVLGLATLTIAVLGGAIWR